MSPAAVIATQAQLVAALDAVRAGPDHHDYPWALKFLAISSKKALAAIRDPRERTRRATEVRKTMGDDHRRRATVLRRTFTAAQTAEIMATEAGHPETPPDPSTIRRWVREARAGKSSM